MRHGCAQMATRRMNTVRFRIKRNALLDGAEKTMALEEILGMKELFATSGEHGEGVVDNFAAISETQLLEIYSEHGPGGLFRLAYMAFSQGQYDFKHFFSVIADELKFRPLLRHEQDLECDNNRLSACKDLAMFNSTVLQPSLSRKLYNPGRQPGYLVYGLGGPKILVSHPFRGINGEFYDVYRNSLDVVTSLILRGYHGTFLFLDNLPGLDSTLNGIPAWLAWFSLIAGHSDVVLFVKQHEGGFGQWQRGEIDFTPDRVQKKIVDIPYEELIWASDPEVKEGTEVIYVTGKAGGSTKGDFDAIEAEHAGPLIEGYATSRFPRDRFIRIDEQGDVTQYPLDYPLYEPSPT
jgi:hypothetical protein